MVLLCAEMGDDAAIAEAKHDANAASAKAASAPLQLMTQFLRTVSENRMEDALALAQTSEIRGVLYRSSSRQYVNVQLGALARPFSTPPAQADFFFCRYCRGKRKRQPCRS